MKTTDNLKIILAEPSSVVRAGIVAVLRRVSGRGLQFVEISTAADLPQELQKSAPDMLIVNPTYWGSVMAHLNIPSRTKAVALLYAPVDENLLAHFDSTISILDSAEEICQKIELLTDSKNVREQYTAPEPISTREKEIIALVAKGLTNKEIADKLFLSLHTVITHRRNIARKLEVRSAAGLTIYAIVNKLISVDEIRDNGQKCC